MANEPRRSQAQAGKDWKPANPSSPARQWLLFYACGSYLLLVVFLSPHPGYREGRSFFEVALASAWDNWWDWAAAWCSLKIILLSLGVCSLLVAVWMLTRGLRRKFLSRAILVLGAAPGTLFGFGLYTLLKALL